MNLLTELKKVEKKLSGRIGIAVEFLDSGERVGLHADEQFLTASLIKTQILCALMERAKARKISLSQKLVLRKKDLVAGSGVLKHMTPGMEITLRDLAVLMIILSDNTATNMVIDALGIKQINERIQAWGYPNTILYRKINFNRSPTDPKWLAVSTPAETSHLLARVARREFLGAKYDKEIEAIMAQQKYDTALPRLLPGSGNWGEQAKPEFVVAHKTGSIDGCRIDCGIVTSPAGRYVVSAFTKDLKDNRYHPDNEGVLAIAAASKLIYDYLNNGAAK